MLEPFSWHILIWPACFILALGFWVGFCVTRSVWVSILVAGLKVFLFVLYFGFFYDGTFTHADDFSYLEVAEAAKPYLTSVADLFSLELYKFIAIKAETTHLAYHIWNILSFHMFGDNYFSPVVLNICLTFFTGLFLQKIVLQYMRFSEYHSKLLFVFFCLHPELLAWSTVLNLKDILVMNLEVMAVYCALTFLTRGLGVRRLLASLGLIFCTLILFQLRYYIPVFFSVSLFIYVFFKSNGWQKNVLFFLAVSFATVILMFGLNLIVTVVSKVAQDYTNPVFGAIRFALTPIPFRAEEAYAYLNLPSLFHWMMLPFFFLGFFFLLRRMRPFVLIGAFFLISFTFYSFYGELQGPRHRAQLIPWIALSQFCGICLFNNSKRFIKSVSVNSQQRAQFYAG